MRDETIKVKLKELCDLKNGFAFKSRDYVNHSKTMNFRMSQIRPGGKINLEHNPKFLPDDYKEKYEDYLLQKGDLVIAMTDMASDTKILGVPTQIKETELNLLLNQRVGKITDLKDEFMDLAYLRYIITSPQIYSYYKALGKGGMQINLGKNDILNAELPLFPLPIQKAIVKKIEELFRSLDSGIADLKKAQDQLVIYRQAVLKKAFEGELTSTVITKKALEPYTELITKGASPKWQGFDYTNDKTELLFITSENVREGYISLEKEKYLPTGFNKVQKRSILKKGDLLLNIVGASIGRAAIFELEKLSNINQAVCLIRLKNNELLKKYLCYYLNSETAKQDYLNKQVDVARANLSLTNVKELEIPFCVPKQQHQIVQEIESRLSVCDAVEQNIKESLEKAQALRQSILKKAFEGRLLSEEEIAACKQHKDYEPAAVLLEKIKAEQKQK